MHIRKGVYLREGGLKLPTLASSLLTHYTESYLTYKSCICVCSQQCGQQSNSDCQLEFHPSPQLLPDFLCLNLFYIRRWTAEMWSLRVQLVWYISHLSWYTFILSLSFLCMTLDPYNCLRGICCEQSPHIHFDTYPIDSHKTYKYHVMDTSSKSC